MGFPSQKLRKMTESQRWRSLSRFVWGGEILVPLSLLLMGIGLWGVLSIYGPVLRVELDYQMKAWATETGLLANDGSLRLIPGFRMGVAKTAAYPEFGLVVPKLYLNAPVVANVNPNDREAYLKALDGGIAHAAGTSLPGQSGLGYFFAHSSGYAMTRPQQQAVFYLLGKLKEGDEVTLFYQSQEYTYRVVRTEVVAANDLSFLATAGMEEKIVLQTCWPIGTSLRRLLVFATRVS